MYTTEGTTSAIRARIAVERRIVKATVTALLKAGYTLSVMDGEEEHPRTTSAAELYKALCETDEDYLYVWADATAPAMTGWVRFIYGNDGWDVINDYTTNLEDVLTPVMALIERLAK